MIGTVRDKDNEEKKKMMRVAFGDNFDKLELRNADMMDAESLDKALEGA